MEEEDTERSFTLLLPSTGAMMDYARHEGFEPCVEFQDKIKSNTTETLHLVHEKRGWKSEED